MDHIDQFEVGDIQVTLHLDDGGGWDPREWDGHFLWLGFPHRNYDIGDERLDPSTFEVDCPADCDGGFLYSEATASTDIVCPRCEGEGVLRPHDMDELIDMVAKQYEARLVRQVGMIDHSGVAYYLGGGAHWCDPGGWDSGTCGLMVATQAQLDEWGISEFTDDQIEAQMKAEIDEYSEWASGQVYGYTMRRILERDEDGEAFVFGEMEESCWGLIGYDNAEAEALADATYHNNTDNKNRSYT